MSIKSQLISGSLESCGYEVDTAFSAKDALSQILIREPDLLISDCYMPGLTGLQLIEQIQSNPKFSKLPILLMSGSLRHDVAPGKNYNAFIKKPFLAEKLIKQVKELLSTNAGNEEVTE